MSALPTQAEEWISVVQTNAARFDLRAGALGYLVILYSMRAVCLKQSFAVYFALDIYMLRDGILVAGHRRSI